VRDLYPAQLQRFPARRPQLESIALRGEKRLDGETGLDIAGSPGGRGRDADVRRPDGQAIGAAQGHGERDRLLRLQIQPQAYFVQRPELRGGRMIAEEPRARPQVVLQGILGRRVPQRRQRVFLRRAEKAERVVAKIVMQDAPGMRHEPRLGVALGILQPAFELHQPDAGMTRRERAQLCGGGSLGERRWALRHPGDRRTVVRRGGAVVAQGEDGITVP